MPSNRVHSRRRFLWQASGATSLAWAGLCRSTRGIAAPAPADEAAGLSTYQLGPQIWVRWDNRPVTCYRAHRSQKYPYLFPLSGPVTGLSLTSETALPYPHHRSLFFGCDRVNGANYWQEDLDRGQILSSGPRLGARADRTVEILDACDWQRPGGPVVMRDERRITVGLPSPRLHWIDWDCRWIAVQDVAIEQTNHALFSARAATDIVPINGGTLVNAEGHTSEKGTFGKASAWCACYGPRAGTAGPVVEGLALFDHPGNPWSPCPWFTRDYGFLSPTPFNFIAKPWTLSAGQSVRIRHRVVLFAGTPADADLPNLHREWTQSAA